MLSSSLTQTHGIEKLSGADNYHHWMVLIRQLLKREKLWATIEPLTEGGELDENENHMNSALTAIFFSLERIPLGNIENETSPKAAWDKLKQLYGGAGPNKLVRILRKTVSTKLEDFSTCDEYIQCVTHAANDLKDTQFGEVSDQVLIALLLAGLPDTYESLRQSIDESTVATTADDVKRRIRDTWNHLNAQGSAFSQASGNQAVPGFFSRGQGRARFGGRRGAFRVRLLRTAEQYTLI